MLISSGIGAIISSLGIVDLPLGVGFVAVEEPWVTRPIPTGTCADASSQFLSQIAKGPLVGETVAIMKAECASIEYGWSPGRYRDVLSAVSNKLDAPIRGFLGSSFAAYRLSWLLQDSRFTIDRAALSNPLLPELPVEAVLRHQSNELRRQALGTEISTGVDVPSGELLAAYASQLPKSPNVMIPVDGRPLGLEQIRQLADVYLGRYGDSRHALGRLAYYQELCSAGFAVGGAPSWDGSTDSPFSFLTAMHGGCPADASGPATLVDNDIKLCISISAVDAVIPLRETVRALEGKDYSVSRLPHNNIRGLSRCLHFMFDGGGGRAPIM